GRCASRKQRSVRQWLDQLAGDQQFGPSEPPVLAKQAEDIGADLGWVAVPVVFPVTVNLPIGAGQHMSVRGAPCADRLIRLVKQLVRPEMSCRSHQAWRRCREADLAMSGERPIELDAHFQVDLTVQVNRNMAACTRDLLCANDIPNGATGF